MCLFNKNITAYCFWTIALRVKVFHLPKCLSPSLTSYSFQWPNDRVHIKKGSRNRKKNSTKKNCICGYMLPMSCSDGSKGLSLVLLLMVSYNPAWLAISVMILKLLGNMRLGWQLGVKSFPPFNQTNQPCASYKVTKLAELWCQMLWLSIQGVKSSLDSQNHNLL